MCNRYGLKTPITAIAAALAQVELPLVDSPAHALPNLEPREHIRPTNLAPVLRPFNGGLHLVELRRGLVPWFHKGALRDFKSLNTNARAETAATLASFKGPMQRRRCLVPASHFFEWTGPKGDKTMWRFERSNAELFRFAGIWERAQLADGPVESFAILTSAPGLDAANYHDRQHVMLEPADYATWLDPALPFAQLVAPPAAHGHLRITKESKVFGAASPTL